MTSEVKLRELIGPAFYGVHRKIRNDNINELVAKGGRGSLKSSFISIEIVLMILNNPDCHAVVLRKVADKLRNSVYNQLKWAIGALKLNSEFHATLSPLEITYKKTGQKILFYGLDDPEQVKSIKLPFGYIGMLWFEELNQFSGEEEIRSVEQSALRGGPFSFSFKSFNPPPMARNWANRYALEVKPGKLVHSSTYLEAPETWLGPRFIADAEYLRDAKNTRYRNEYLGEVVGSGTQVFDNLVIAPISMQKIMSFDPVVAGVDWGWYPDPWAFNRGHFAAGQNSLYIFDEDTRWKMSNKETAAIVKARIGKDDRLTADSSEEKSCSDYREYGLECRGARKGPGSVKRGMKWLQSLNAIYIDPEHCPVTAKEFSEYEYEVDKNGIVLPGFVDMNNHQIDATRYMTNHIWTRRGAI